MLIASVFWKQEVSNGRYSGDGTHVKDLKNLVQIRPTGGNLFLVALCMQMSRNPITFSLLGNIPFDLRHSPRVR